MSSPPIVAAAPEAALDGWALDEAFLDEAMRRAAAVSLVTFDVFDTALTRLVDSPADLFAVVEQDLAARSDIPAGSYAALRERAERDARSRLSGGREDLDLDTILDEVVRLRPALAPFRSELERAELAAERRLVAATPDILELCRRLSAAGIRFGFVSDMYLSEAQIGALLAAGGFHDWAFLLVSSATGLTKHGGRQWDVLRARHGAGAILHIGDDAHADLRTPRSRDIEVLGYLRARSSRRTGARLDPALVPGSLLRRDAVLRSRTRPAPEHGSVAGGVSAPEPDWWRTLGRTLGGPVLAGFISWLEAQVRRHRIDTLHFLARDGFLLRRAWRESGAERRTGLEGRYLCVSRRTLNLSRGFLDGRDWQLDQALLSFLASSDGTLTVAAALDRIGLADDAELRAAALSEFGALSAVLRWPDGTGRFEKLLARHAATIHRHLGGEHALLMRYLREEGLANEFGRIGLVDLGWHATMQRSLRTILERDRGDTVNLYGFYYGLWPNTLGNLLGAGPVDAAFCSPFRTGPDQRALAEAVEVLEELHSAPHGTVRGYRDQDGRTQPVFADSPVERAQYDAITQYFQDGALDAVRQLFEGGELAGMTADRFDPDAALAAIAGTVLSPEPDELLALGGLRHAATFDHSGFVTLVPPGHAPDDEDERIRVLQSSGWRVGTLLNWIERAEPERRAALRDWGRFMLGPGLGERALRRFG